MMMRERDPVLRRIERDSIAACGLFAAIAGVVSGQMMPVVGVLVGGGLVALSYWTIKGSADRFASSPTRPTVAIGWLVLRVLGRYALLAGIAYVTIVRLHLPPLGLLVGVSAIVVGTAVEGIRALVGRRSAS